MFIALEGIDGSGTTTQAKALTTALGEQGYEVLSTAQPSKGAMGTLARTMLGESEPPHLHRSEVLALAFAGDRLDHYDRVIAPALAAGAVVICDRYLLSSWVYQSLDLSLAWVQEVNRFAPWPDLTLFLDLDADRAHARVKQRAGPKEIYDQLELQTRLAAGYRELAKELKDRAVHTVPADLPISTLCQTLLDIILQAKSPA